MLLILKNLLLYLMALLYIAAGINHFIHPATYMKIMPSFLPFHYQLVLISGFCEVVLGVLLIIPITRRIAAIGIIALLIAVFPANIYMFINYLKIDHPLLWLATLRLPLQVLLIWWSYKYAKG